MLDSKSYTSSLIFGMQLAVYISERVPELVVGDPGRFRQIITNLMSNSIKVCIRLLDSISVCYSSINRHRHNGHVTIYLFINSTSTTSIFGPKSFLMHGLCDNASHAILDRASCAYLDAPGPHCGMAHTWWWYYHFKGGFSSAKS